MTAPLPNSLGSGLVLRLGLNPVASLEHSPVRSNFSHGQLVPEEPLFARLGSDPESRTATPDASSIFEATDHGTELLTEPTIPDEPTNYDLKPPPPPPTSHHNAESLCEQLFSVEHLNVIVRDQALAAKFANFVGRYRPQLSPLVTKYQDIQKVKSAIDYANALAQSLPSIGPNSSPNGPAAILVSKFEQRSRKAVEQLLADALPAYVTHCLVQLVTDCLVKEITGSNPPIMHEMVQGLAEVYCMTDPGLPDNPIVYASEEFYRATQYGREYAIGRNCRFLQGPRTSTETVQRMSQAMKNGVEICETVLNYRRDGTPFVNLLLIAPLYDDKGRVRYFVGCQIDITKLIEGGRGLTSFRRLLARSPTTMASPAGPQSSSLKALAELGQQLGREEMDAVRQRSDSTGESGRNTPPPRPGTARRFFGIDDEPERVVWPPSNFGPSGRLPGVYQHYMLVRPFPSLRITFTSASLRIPGMLQSKLFDRIQAPPFVRDGILEALTEGIGVTAKINWLANIGPGGDREGAQGRQRWIHCTPLIGSDERVGVWMVVMVENDPSPANLTSFVPTRVPSPDPVPSRTMSRRASSQRLRHQPERVGSGRLYAQYLRESRACSREEDRELIIPSRATKLTQESMMEFGLPTF